MKKYGLVKVLLVMLLLVVIATYCIEGRYAEISYLPLGDVFINYIQSYYYFFDTAVFILVVGGFYGLLNRTKAYRKMLDIIADKFSDNKKKFVIASTIIFAVVASLTGFNLVMLLFIPFVVSIILLLGYDKLVALSATVGAVLVGFIGGVFTTVSDSAGMSTFETLVGLDDKWGNIFPKILLLVLVCGLLVLYICKYIKRLENDKGYELTKNDALLIETKDKSGKVVKANYEGVKVWPLATMLVIFLVLLVLGFIPWYDLFEISVFDDFHTWLTGLSIGDYTVFSNLISSNFSAFGTWYNLGNFMMPIVLVALFSLIIKFVYRIKLDSAFEAIVVGAKKMLPAVMIAMLAYTVLVCSYNNGFVETIITNASESFPDNVVVNSLITILGSITNVDLYYTTAGVFSPIVSVLSDGANLSVYAIAFQSLYGLVGLIGPTSLLLIVGLTYLEVPYKTWVKYIWRFILELFIVIFIVMMIVNLL